MTLRPETEDALVKRCDRWMRRALEAEAKVAAAWDEGHARCAHRYFCEASNPYGAAPTAREQLDLCPDCESRPPGDWCIDCLAKAGL
jgi:hypothetical protein